MQSNAVVERQLPDLLAATASRHRHLCPRQVLGVRMGLAAAAELGVAVPRADKRLLTFVETDGCGADGVAVAIGCSIGRRTLRVLDYGKLAATVFDRRAERAVRVRPSLTSRELAAEAMPGARSRWHAMLEAYQTIPSALLFDVQAVTLTVDVEALISRPAARQRCEGCGEEVMNERERVVGGRILCPPCADGGYYVAV